MAAADTILVHLFFLTHCVCVHLVLAAGVLSSPQLSLVGTFYEAPAETLIFHLLYYYSTGQLIQPTLSHVQRQKYQIIYFCNLFRLIIVYQP